MIRGYFAARGAQRRPMVDAVIHFPALSPRPFEVRLMVDTSADRTVLAPLDAARVQRELGMDLTTLPEGQPSIGVGGQMNTRTLEAILTLDTFSAPLTSQSSSRCLVRPSRFHRCSAETSSRISLCSSKSSPTASCCSIRARSIH